MQTAPRRVFVTIAVAWFVIGIALLPASYALYRGVLEDRGVPVDSVTRVMAAMYQPTGDLAARAYGALAATHPGLAEQEPSGWPRAAIFFSVLATNSLLWAALLTGVLVAGRRLRRSVAHREGSPPPGAESAPTP